MVCSDGAVRRIPVYSGNAFRGMLRDLAAQQLLATLQVQLPPPVFHFLTSGGSLTAGDGNRSIDVDQARRLRDAVPMVGVFGGGVGSQILEGKLTVLSLTPICAETLHVLPAYCRDAPSARLSVRDLRTMEFGTRRDDSKRESSQPYLLPGPAGGPDDLPTSMIYESEALAPGACLRFGFHLRGATPREQTCLLAALVGWLAHPFLGGRAAAGYGEVATPQLWHAERRLALQDESAIVDLRRPLAQVDSVVDREQALTLAAAEIEQAYRADVESRRDDLLRALGEVV